MKIALISDTHGICRDELIVIISFTPGILTTNVLTTDS